MLCLTCNKEFVAKRTDAKYCSPKCRKIASRVTDNSVTDNVTDNSIPVTDKISVTKPLKSPKDSWLCKIKGCNLKNLPGHQGMCIYHWRKDEGLDVITDKQCEEVNTMKL